MTNLLLGLCFCATVVQAALPLQDANAYIDQLFTYKIDSADFPNQHVKVSEAASGSLPAWLNFDPETLTLKGIPGIKDLGTYIFSVGPDPSEAQDAFAVIVSHHQRLEVAQATNSEEQAVICKPHDTITMVNVMINADLNQLTTAIKTGLLEALSSHLSLQPKHISLKPNSGKGSESAPLVAGPGDSKPDASNAASVISWVVGCGAVKSHQMDVLELLETSAKTGKLSELLRQGVLGWQVISDTPKIITNRRLKREIRATATPTPGGESTATTNEITDVPTVLKESNVTIASITDSISTPSPTPILATIISTDAATLSTSLEEISTETSATTVTTATTSVPSTSPNFTTTISSTTPSSATRTHSTTLSTSLASDTTSVTMSSSSTVSPTIKPVTRSTTLASSTLLLTTPMSPLSSPSTVVRTSDPDTTPSTLEVEETTQPAVSTVEISSPPPITTPPPRPMQSKPILDESKKPAKQMVEVGKLLEYMMPTGLFTNKDGDDPFMYEVVELNSENINRPSSWIMYDREAKTVYALPTADDEGLHKFSIVATDNSNGLSSNVAFDIEVAPADESRVSMLYMMYVKAPFRGEPQKVLDLAVQLTEDEKVENIYVKSTQRDGDMVIVTLGEDLNREDCSDNGDTSSTRRKLQMEDYYIRRTATTLMISSLRLMPKEPCVNTPPKVGSYFKKGGENIKIIIGQLYRKELPVDAFVDDEDIDLRFMTLKLNLFGTEKVARDLISLDSRKLKALVWEPTASSQYELVAEDSMGATVKQALNVELVAKYSGNPSHLFSITLDENYSKFANNHDQQVMLYEKLEEAFPNNDLTFKRVGYGSVIIDFTLENNAMEATAEGECPVKQLDALNEKIFAADGSIRESFSKRLPSLTKAEFIPQGDCEGEIESKSGVVKKPTPAPGKGDDGEDNNLVIIIIVVVAVIVVILIIVVVVIVVRRKRTEKMNVSRNNGTYIEKGIPKVFDEEMKDVGKNEPNESQPLMADGERPAPPAYPQNGKKAGDGTSDSSYHPPTPPLSEPDENRQQYDKSP